MSLELQLAWPCTHITLEEVVTLDYDRQWLQTSQPVASLGAMRILIDNELLIPQFGLSVPAALRSFVAGPFDLVPTENVVTITAPAGTQTIALNVTVPVRRTAAELANELLRRGLTVALPEDDGHGYLLLSDTSRVGSDSFVRVSGSAATTLGFGAQLVSDRPWRAQGRDLYPGWDLLKSGLGRRPKFRVPILGTPVIKVSYTTTVSQCRRCRSTFVENDYRFTVGGDAIFIQNEDLLYQAALKILLTDLGSNPFHRWYGSRIRSRIGAKAVGGVASLISEDVRKALQNLQQLQVKQSQYQQVSNKERLYAVLNVQVRPHQQDPTTFLVDVVVQNASGDPVQLNIVFTVPSTVALMGSNMLYLGGPPR
ncbi:MAG: hypothetical protein A2Y38_00485 [Spirochaetes bacterium GWB1_59_5]|nr:MAG: hypothetical protein A2Y38_00485 [Spirochaetes bacterium GWB1_59_5]